ncbi:MAG: PDZ domain-containing protein [Candidatus Buchananbacteria bacterium]|nr:PDZ domain-containing protein [Candidatus Buchananbacteria bacterium]
MPNEKKQSKFGINLISILILVVILGFFAGISGEFFTKYYLSNLAFFRDLYFTEQTDLGQREIIIREPKKVVVEQDLRINQLKNEIQPSIVGVYKKKTTVKNLLDKIFLPADYLGQAVVLTSDGWLISTADVINSNKDNLIISYDKQIYEIDKIIKDDLSRIVFIKITAQNLPVIRLVDFTDVNDGQQVFMYNSYSDQLNLANIQDKRHKIINNKYDFISSSENLDKHILLDRELDNEYNGSPLVNFQGEIIGLLSGQTDQLNQAIPLHYINEIISQVLKDEEINRPKLGINYINLNQAYGLTEEDRQGLENGVLLWPNQNGIAIKQDSPLFGKLVSGDIITSIEDQKIDQGTDLLDILLQYKTGQEISLGYWHEGNEQELSLILQ